MADLVQRIDGVEWVVTEIAESVRKKTRKLHRRRFSFAKLFSVIDDLCEMIESGVTMSSEYEIIPGSNLTKFD